MPPGPDTSRRAVLLAGLAALAGTAGGCGGGAAGGTPVAQGSGTPAAAVPWVSGAAGPGAADGAFGRWRGAPVEIVGTWADTNEAMVALWQLRDGGELVGWAGDLDVAVGAIGTGESWGEAAAGAYDARWGSCLENLAAARAGATGTTFVRLAHEFNGDWYPWRVLPDEVADFAVAWRRFRTLQRELAPAARLVFCVNRETTGSDLDWRRAFPGPGDVDVLAVDYYNQYPFVRSAGEWEDTLDEVDAQGAPKGLAAHLAFARDAGVPAAVSEWSSNADMGDSPVFVEQMYGFFGRHGGSGPGQVLYEIQFNVDRDGARWSLHPTTRMPEATAAYRRLWRSGT